VRAAVGSAARVSPATRSARARHVVPAARSREAAALRTRRGLACDGSSLARLSTATAEASPRRREAARAAALRVPVPSDGPWAGQRVRGRLAGGRGRRRRTHRGRKTATGRHGFSTPWREPRLLGSDLLAGPGRPARLRVPLYEGLLGAAEAVWARLRGSGRLRGAAEAEGVECLAAGADWRWHRVERRRTLAEIPAAKLVEVLAVSHARP